MRFFVRTVSGKDKSTFSHGQKICTFVGVVRMHNNIGVTRSHFAFSQSTVITFDFYGKCNPLFTGARDVRTTTRTMASDAILRYIEFTHRRLSCGIRSSGAGHVFFFCFFFCFFFLHTITPLTRTVLVAEDDICTISIILNVHRYALSAVTTAAQLLFFEIKK